MIRKILQIAIKVISAPNFASHPWTFFVVAVLPSNMGLVTFNCNITIPTISSSALRFHSYPHLGNIKF